MKRSFFPFFIIFSLIIIIFSCSSNAKRSRKPVITITLNQATRNFVIGNDVTVNVVTKLKNGEINTIQLYYENELIKTEKSLNFEYTLKNISKLGSNSIKVIATKTDDVANTRIKNFSVISDIVPKKYTYKIIKEYPHSTDFFTEGLLMYDGFLYESTGQKNKSAIYKLNAESGRIIQSKPLNNKYFGEGITILNDKIYQLTYKAQLGFVYNLSDFSIIDSFKIKSAEGWGLTNDGSNLIMSDGTNRLTWFSPNNLAPIKTLYVADNKNQVKALNELEYINGSIFANLWTQNSIVEIDPKTGKIISTIDLSGLQQKLNVNLSKIDVLNGIAYKKETGNLLVTGKWWPKLFEIQLLPSE